MALHVKGRIFLWVLILFGFIQPNFGAEKQRGSSTQTVMLTEQDISQPKIVRLGDSNIHMFSDSVTVESAPKVEPPKQRWWSPLLDCPSWTSPVTMPLLFIATLVDPLVDAAQGVGGKLGEKGLWTCGRDLLSSAGQTVKDHPVECALDTLALAGSVYLGQIATVGEAGWALQLTSYASKTKIALPLIKKAPEVYNTEREKVLREGFSNYVLNRGRFVADHGLEILKSDTFWKVAMTSAGAYIALSMIESLPGVDGQIVNQTFGTQFQVAASADSGFALTACPKTGGAILSMNNGGDIAVYGLSGSAVTLGPITVSAAFTSNSATCSTCSSSGPCLTGWLDSANTQATYTTYWPNNGTIISSPAVANTPLGQTVGSMTCGVNSDHTFELQWREITAAPAYNFKTLQINQLTGAPIGTPVLYNTNTITPQNPDLYLALPTTPSTGLSVSAISSGTTSLSVRGGINYANGTAVIPPVTLSTVANIISALAPQGVAFSTGDSLLGINWEGYPSFLPVSATGIPGNPFNLTVAASGVYGMDVLANGDVVAALSYQNSTYGVVFTKAGVMQSTVFQIPVTALDGQLSGPVVSLGGTYTNPTALSVYVNGPGALLARSINFQGPNPPTTGPTMAPSGASFDAVSSLLTASLMLAASFLL